MENTTSEIMETIQSVQEIEQTQEATNIANEETQASTNSNNSTNSTNEPNEPTYSFKATSLTDYILNTMGIEVEEYLNDSHIKTGFANWDEIIGCLKTGLYVIGANTSLGKTTFMYQTAEQLAEAGEDVLFFSYENTRFQLASKSISRYMAKSNMTTAIPSNQIEYNFDKDEVKDAITHLSTYSDRLITVECGFHSTIEEIEKYVVNYIKEHNKKPIVFIDYLQLIQTENKTLSPKDKVDCIIGKLKQLQKDNKLVLFVISSFNRQNYMQVVSYESFKESGGIDYTADVILGMQLQAIHNPIFDEQGKMNEKRKIIGDAKKAIPRKIELTAIKNRLGSCIYNCNFIYYPQFDYFIPDDSPDPEGAESRVIEGVETTDEINDNFDGNTEPLDNSFIDDNTVLSDETVPSEPEHNEALLPSSFNPMSTDFNPTNAVDIANASNSISLDSIDIANADFNF